MRSGREQTLIRETRVLWQEHYAYFLSEDEAKQILVNVTDFFTLLQEWDQQSNAACRDEHVAEQNTGGDHAA